MLLWSAMPTNSIRHFPSATLLRFYAIACSFFGKNSCPFRTLVLRGGSAYDAGCAPFLTGLLFDARVVSSLCETTISTEPAAAEDAPTCAAMASSSFISALIAEGDSLFVEESRGERNLFAAAGLFCFCQLLSAFALLLFGP